MALTSHHNDRRSKRYKKVSKRRDTNFVGKAMYEGPSKSKVKQSLRYLVNDQVDQSQLPINRDCRSFTRFLHAMDRYFDDFFDQMRNLENSELSKQLAEDCKNMNQKCQALVDDLCRFVFSDEYELSAILKPKGKDGYWLEKIYYLPKEFDILFIDEEEGILCGIHHQNTRLTHGYHWLAQAIVLLMGNAYESIDIMLEEDFIKLKQLANAVMSFGSLFQFMNPDDQGLDRQADATIDAIESAKLEYPEPPEEFLVIWDEFLADLSEGKLPYVRELSRALRLTEEYRKSPFCDDDYYISNKATSRRDSRYKGIRQSILASGFEECHHEDDPIIKEAESIIGYTCHYNPDEGNQPRKDVISREIRNPGKYKARLIKIGDNEMQDICNYIMRRFKAVTSLLECSCTENQSEGLDFGLKITHPAYIEAHQNNVFCWDWEDCTNNVAHWFDKACFSLVFPDLAPLWEHLCKYKAYHKYAVKGKEDRSYSSEDKGQPQGFGGSFDDMDWFHVIIAELEMLMTKRKEIRLSEFLRDLGDDDATNTVTPDPEAKDDPLYKDEPGYRTEVQLAFRRICSWVGLKINDSKCIFNEYNPKGDNIYEYEFAKVRIRAGKFDSPIPPRIAAKYYLPAYQLIALNWQLDHGWTSKNFIDVIIDREFSDPAENYLAKLLYKSGVVKGKVFDKYQDPSMTASPRLLALVKGAYYVSAIKTSSLFHLISDGKNQFERFSINAELDAFKALVNSPKVEEIWMNIVDNDHKFNKLLLRNEEIANTIGLLFDLDERPSLYASLLMVTSESIRDGYRQTKRLMSLFTFWGEDQTEDYLIPEAILSMDCSKITKACDVMLFKSSRKKGRQELIISHKAVQEALRVLSFLPSCKAELDEAIALGN